MARAVGSLVGWRSGGWAKLFSPVYTCFFPSIVNFSSGRSARIKSLPMKELYIITWFEHFFKVVIWFFNRCFNEVSMKGDVHRWSQEAFLAVIFFGVVLLGLTYWFYGANWCFFDMLGWVSPLKPSENGEKFVARWTPLKVKNSPGGLTFTSTNNIRSKFSQKGQNCPFWS